MGRTHKQRRRTRRTIRTQPTNPPQRRKPLSVVPADHASDDADNEFRHDDGWLEPYEPTEEVL